MTNWVLIAKSRNFKFNNDMVDENKKSLQFDVIIQAPFGSVGLAVQGMQLSIELLPQQYEPKSSDNKLAQQAASQIEAYFENAQNGINLPLVFKGTPFQKNVWQYISAIPTGSVATYGEIARALGSGPRAVANACGANYTPLLVPCHRVVAEKGLGGFMRNAPNGMPIKKWLLKHEGVAV